MEMDQRKGWAATDKKEVKNKIESERTGDELMIQEMEKEIEQLMSEKEIFTKARLENEY
jgi:hypothetical protein